MLIVHRSSQFFEQLSKRKKSLVKPIKEKRGNTQINKIQGKIARKYKYNRGSNDNIVKNYILITLKPRRNRKREVPKLVQETEDMNRQTNIFRVKTKLQTSHFFFKKKNQYTPRVHLVLEVNSAKIPKISYFLNYTIFSREKKKQKLPS